MRVDVIKLDEFARLYHQPLDYFVEIGPGIWFSSIPWPTHLPCPTRPYRSLASQPLQNLQPDTVRSGAKSTCTISCL